MVQETEEENISIAISKIVQNNPLGSFSLKKVIFTIVNAHFTVKANSWFGFNCFFFDCQILLCFIK